MARILYIQDANDYIENIHMLFANFFVENEKEISHNVYFNFTIYYFDIYNSYYKQQKVQSPCIRNSDIISDVFHGAYYMLEIIRDIYNKTTENEKKDYIEDCLFRFLNETIDTLKKEHPNFYHRICDKILRH